MDGEDVVAQPHAGVGELHAGGPGALGERGGERPGVARLDPLLEVEEAGRLGEQAAVDPAGDEPVVVVAAEHQQLAVGPERAAEILEQRAGERERVAVRAVAQLEPVAEDHEPVDAAHGLHQRLAQLGAPQQVSPLGRADVKVRDHQRPHAS